MSAHPPTILIADDNPTNLNVLFEYLSAQGYRVLVAEDGTGAIEQAQYGLPDLILLDVMMPGLDGFETCQQLKAAPETRNIPVIFMTAISETAYVLKGFSVGAVDYITKPLQREEVNARVKTHISIRRLQRELEEEISTRLKAEEELRVINAGKDVFFSVLAHDLKNPMGGLLGMSEELVRTMPTDCNEETKEMAVDVRNASRQVSVLLLDLLGWAQMQLGKMDPKPKAVSLTEQVSAAVALANLAAKPKLIEITNDIIEPVQIFCDIQMNDTVLRNVLGNAVKFAPKSGRVRIFAQKLQGEIQVTVTDSGKGIAADRLAGLFRLGENKTTFGSAGEKGTGLGLPLCGEMVTKNGGRIWAESPPGEGASFHFTVPLA